MSEGYNINVGVPTSIKSLIELTTYKYHPYGLENFRKELLDHIEECQNKGLEWKGYDNLTHAWRTPWDYNYRQPELMSPITQMVIALAKEHSPKSNWYLRDCWISEYKHSSAANKHNHGDDSMGWSFCYYVKMPDVGPAFGLCDDITNTIHQLNVAEGDLLLFRHTLQHQVFPSTEKRVIISGNLAPIDHDIMYAELFYNENYLDQSGYSQVEHGDLDVDDWKTHVFKQKLDLDVEHEGY